MGSVFGQEFLRHQGKERKEDSKTERDEKRDRWWMRHIMHFVKKQKKRSLSPHTCLWSNYPLRIKVVSSPSKRIPQHTSAKLFRLLVPHGKEEGSKGSREEGCTLKSRAMVTQESRVGGVGVGGWSSCDISHHSLLSSLLVMRFAGCFSASPGIYMCVSVCICVQ